MPSFGPISSAPVGAAPDSGVASATAYPLGVSAAASVGVAVATGGAQATPAGVGMTAGFGTATAAGGALASPVGLGVAMSVGTAAATGAGSGAAVAQPAGVSAAILVGTATATGGAAASATAYPVGVSAFARVGFAIASGSGAAGSIPSDYQFHAGHRVRLYTGQQGDFSPKRAAEVEIYGVDFADELAIGETISAVVWSITPVNGVDPAASSMIIGSAQLTGSVSAQRIGGGVPGIRYAPICTVQTSLGQTLVLPEYGVGQLEVTL